MDGIDWGTVPSWVGSIGTVVALLLGVLTLRSELKQRRHDREMTRRAQASLVTAWTGLASRSEIDDARDIDLERDEAAHLRAVVISNRGDHAVYEIFWTIWDRETEAQMDSGFVRALAPQAQTTVLVPGPLGGDSEVHLNFTDSNAILWFRTDRLLSVGEWWDHPDREKWNDPERVWTRLWAPDIVRALGGEPEGSDGSNAEERGP